MAQIDVGKALRDTPKGRLKYDKYWAEEGRTKEILDDISEFSTNVSIHISPKVLSQVINAITQVKFKDDEKKNNSIVKLTPTKSSEKCKDSDTYLYELQSETELPILEYEEGRLKYLQEIFKAKKEEFENFSKNLEQQTEQQYYLLKKNNELDEKRKSVVLKKIEDDIIEEAKERERLQEQRFQTQAKKLSAIVQEAELKQKKEEEEKRKREQEQQEFSLQLSNCRLEVENLILKMKQKLLSFEHVSYLKVPVKERMSQFTKFLDGIKLIIDSTKSEPLKIEDVSNSYFLVRKAYESIQDMTNDIELAKMTALHDHEKHSFESKEIHKIPIVSSESAATMNSATGGNEISQDHNVETARERTKSKISSEAKAVLSSFIAPDVVEEYHKIMENLKAIKDSIQAFIDDPRNKKVRFELQKSINVPINAISSVSGAHVRDKISRLLSILGNKASSKEMTNESVTYNFCANLIARKFVEQGDMQISAQHLTAFPIAMAIVGVWIRKPEVGSLILGHLYSNCPYLIPFYPQHKENQREQEYFQTLGYCFDKEGNVEVKYKFLNRMSGFMRLFAAILVSSVPTSTAKQPHPFGIAQGWQWLSRVLNMDPRPDITATLLYDFLEVAGHALQKTYGKQFKKLLHIICKDFFQKIKRVTPSGSGGPVERLETFLQETVKKGYIPPPEGILDAAFWNR